MIKHMLLEANLLKHLRNVLNIPGITDVHALEAGGATAILWIAAKKMYSGHIDQIVMATLGYFGMSYYKWIVVTDDDVDIRDPFMRDWVMAWRVRPDKDMRIIADTAMVELDPSSLKPDLPPDEIKGAKVIIDATRKWQYPDISLPPLKRMKQVAENWSAYGLPPLGELKLPRDS
jgi:UbiD family decarboxylase